MELDTKAKLQSKIIHIVTKQTLKNFTGVFNKCTETIKCKAGLVPVTYYQNAHGKLWITEKEYDKLPPELYGTFHFNDTRMISSNELRKYHITVIRYSIYKKSVSIMGSIRIRIKGTNEAVLLHRTKDGRCFILKNSYDRLRQGTKANIGRVFASSTPNQIPPPKKDIADNLKKMPNIVITGDSIICRCKRYTLRINNQEYKVHGYISEASGSLLMTASNFLRELPPKVYKQLSWSDPQRLLARYTTPTDMHNSDESRAGDCESTAQGAILTDYFPVALAKEYETQHGLPSDIDSLFPILKVWLQSKQIFVYEDEFAASLIANVDAVNDIQAGILLHCPYTAAYIMAKDTDSTQLEYFATLTDNKLQLSQIKDESLHGSCELVIQPGSCGKDILTAMQGNIDIDTARKLLQLYTCLCAAQLDDITLPSSEQPPIKTEAGAERPAPTHQKKPTWDADVYTVTMRPGAGKKKRSITQNTNTDGTPRRPHTRRAHWHHVWTGPRNLPEGRQLVLKWFPETSVNAASDDLPAKVILVRRR